MKLLYILKCILIIALFVSCKENAPTDSSQTGKAKVYVAGYEVFDGKKTAMLWVDGEPVKLSEGSDNAEANSVFVSGDDVYVVGNALLGNSRIAMLWKNDLRIPISFKHSNAHSIVVENNQIHIAGESMDNSTQTVATYWNGSKFTPTHLNTDLSYGYSLFIKDNNVYVAGEKGLEAAYWKNEKNGIVPLNGSKVYSVFVSGNNDIYVAGVGNLNNITVPVYWKNGTPVYLSKESINSAARSICINGNEIYVGGYITDKTYQPIAVIWKNKTETRLTDGIHPAGIHSLTVVNGKIYAAGYERVDKSHYVAVLWEDEKPVYLGSLSGTSYANSVYVRK